MRAQFAGIALAVWLASGTALAAPCAGFTDVDSSSAFCVNVEWLKSHNITLGCTATTYCPNEAVTRLQMAAFLNRLGNISFQQGGNAFGATAVLGSQDNQTVAIIADNKVAFRINPMTDSPQIIGGAANNGTFAVQGATIAGGGGPNSAASCIFSSGCANLVTDNYGTIGGGLGNFAGNGDQFADNAQFATVAGGINNQAGGISATVGGGQRNIASGEDSTIAGGGLNIASGIASTVVGGGLNTASGYSSVVLGGQNNSAAGDNTLVAGANSNGASSGCVIFSNGFSGNQLTCGPNQILIGALGGYFFYTSVAGAGVTMGPGAGAWSSLSDRASKTNIRPVDPASVLDHLASVPVNMWEWKSEPGNVQHMGPIAQDFYAAFRLGDSDKRIVTVDADGVALAAIQGLNAKFEASQALIAEQARELAQQSHDLTAIKAQLAAMAAAH